jgi:hypothetical protein
MNLRPWIAVLLPTEIHRSLSMITADAHPEAEVSRAFVAMNVLRIDDATGHRRGPEPNSADLVSILSGRTVEVHSG